MKHEWTKESDTSFVFQVGHVRARIARAQGEQEIWGGSVSGMDAARSFVTHAFDLCVSVVEKDLDAALARNGLARFRVWSSAGADFGTEYATSFAEAAESAIKRGDPTATPDPDIVIERLDEHGNVEAKRRYSEVVQ